MARIVEHAKVDYRQLAKRCVGTYVKCDVCGALFQIEGCDEVRAYKIDKLFPWSRQRFWAWVRCPACRRDATFDVPDL